ncbi:MAG: response regulator, partial [Bacteroidota bacterium]
MNTPTTATETARKILWVDDEIDLLRAHVRLLEQKGYEVDTATNGEDAVEMVKTKNYELVFLDEMMAGMGGLQTLSQIKEILPSIPIVMVTKNEAESLMEEAIGGKISDYLLKPVNPNQVLMACKKFLEAKKITGQVVSRDYTKEFQQIALALMGPLDHDGWAELYVKLTNWDLELDDHPELGLRQTLLDQKRECNVEFGKYIERNYQNWIEQKSKKPLLSNEVVEQRVLPEIDSPASVFLLVVDCLRLDQWLVMEQLLADFFNVQKDYYFSILPTATPYSRNAIFSGLFPAELEKRFPEIWQAGEDDETSRNRHEHQLLDKLLERKRVQLKPESK